MEPLLSEPTMVFTGTEPIGFVDEEARARWEFSLLSERIIVVTSPWLLKSTHTHATPREAGRALRRLVLELLDDGFALEGALPLFGAPNDPQELIAADHAAERGDPRARRTHALARLVSAAPDDWPRAWTEFVKVCVEQPVTEPPRSVVRLAWAGPASLDATRRALEDPKVARATRLEIAAGDQPVEPLLELLEPAVLPGLRFLSIDSSARHAGSLAGVLGARPFLQALRVYATNFELGTAPTRLTRLVVRPHKYLFSAALKSLRAPIFPSLARLSMDVPVADDIFPWLLSGEHFPALRTLRIMPTSLAVLVPSLTKKAKLLPRLHRLDLLGRLDYAALKDWRRLAPVLAPIPRVGVGVSREGVQFARLQELVPGLESITGHEL